MLPGAVPEAGDTLSHGTVAVAVQLSVPLRGLEIAIACDTGAEPPAV